MNRQEKKRQRREFVRNGKMSEHHLKPRSRGGQSIQSNLLKLDIRRHEAWHLLFGNLTLPEIIQLLERVYNIKELQRFKKYL